MNVVLLILTILSALLPLIRQLFEALNTHRGALPTRAHKKLETFCNEIEEVQHIARSKYGVVTHRQFAEKESDE